MPALEKAFASETPSLLDVRVDPKELIIPPRITLEQAANFGLAKVKEFFELTTYRGLVLQIVQLSASASTVGSPTSQVDYQDFCKE